MDSNINLLRVRNTDPPTNSNWRQRRRGPERERERGGKLDASTDSVTVNRERSITNRNILAMSFLSVILLHGGQDYGDL